MAWQIGDLPELPFSDHGCRQRIPEVRDDPDDPRSQSQQIQHLSDPSSGDALLPCQIGPGRVLPGINGFPPFQGEGDGVTIRLLGLGPRTVPLACVPFELSPESSTYVTARGAILMQCDLVPKRRCLGLAKGATYLLPLSDRYDNCVS